MPELPEVETITRELNQVLPSARITGLAVGLPKIIKLPLRRFRSSVIGARVKQVHRRAKLALIDLSNDQTIVIHLKMSGQLILQPSRLPAALPKQVGTRLRRRSAGNRANLIVGGHPIPGGTQNLPNKYSHVIFITTKGTLFFNDQRQFGFVRLIKTGQLENWFNDHGYGPEPLTDDFTFALFSDLLKRHRVKRVKPTIMDQHMIAGVGNIYADEACHFAKIKPGRRIASLTQTERRALYHGIRHVLNLAIKHRGTTAADYLTASGTQGDMKKFLRVYGRTGLPCKRCGGSIKKITLAQRGTHYCPNCQR